MENNNEVKTLGQMIGLNIDNFSVKNDVGEKVQLKITFNYTTATDQEIISWLNGNRRIAFQTPARSLTRDELKELSGTVVSANRAGQKIQSKSQRIAEAKATIEALKEEFPEEFGAVQEEIDNARTMPEKEVEADNE